MQAQRAFEAVLPDRSTGLFTGRTKDADADVVFAAILTLGRKRHRSRFPQHDFDLVIVDEFHHAAAATYTTVDWFQRQFLLGITATPDRADGREVYALCDRNVAYRMEFLEAIERGWLSPFHYVGVYDDTDYSQIRWLGTKYDEEELLSADAVYAGGDGVRCIETKDYSGWIFGKEADRNWTQTIYKSKKRFLNPIIQNKGHVKALQTVLNVLEVFVPIVAFDGGAELKVQVTSPVLHIRKLSAYISDYRQLRFSIDDVQRLAQSITTLNVMDSAKRRAHV